jgi:hypothetical protein
MTLRKVRPPIWLVALAWAGLDATAAGPQERPVTDERVAAVVDAQVKEWWTKPEEKRFDAIGWAADLRSARRLSAKHDRPLFLFTMDGRVNTGRC